MSVIARRPPRSTLFPYTTPSDLPERAFEAGEEVGGHGDPSPPLRRRLLPAAPGGEPDPTHGAPVPVGRLPVETARSEEHTSELQSHSDLVCRLLLEKKKFRIDRV